MDESYKRAKKRVEDLKGFYGHLTAYIVVILFLTIFNAVVTPGFWWVIFIAIPWGIGLLAHGLSVYLSRGVFSKEWEEKKIKEYMEKENE